MMRLRSGITIPSGNIVTASPVEEVAVIGATISGQSRTDRMDYAITVEPRTSFQTLKTLIENARFGIDLDKMLKVSQIYDIILSDKGAKQSPEYRNLLNIMRGKASEHLENITSETFLRGLSETDIACQKHFCCLLEKYIDGTYGTPADYREYSYHYDILSDISYDEAVEIRAKIFSVALETDFDETSIREYLENRLSVYQLYAVVTYFGLIPLNNNVEYSTVIEIALGWFYRPERA